MKPDVKRLAYLAGLFDGEGCFCIQVKIREHKGVKRIALTPRMTMSLYYGPEALHLLQGAFGGAIYFYPDGGMRWNISKRSSVQIAASALQPHLVIKSKICQRYLEALSFFPPIRERQWQGKRSWTNESILKVAEIAYTLNPICAKKAAKNAASLQQIKKMCEGGQ